MFYRTLTMTNDKTVHASEQAALAHATGLAAQGISVNVVKYETEEAARKGNMLVSRPGEQLVKSIKGKGSDDRKNS